MERTLSLETAKKLNQMLFDLMNHNGECAFCSMSWTSSSRNREDHAKDCLALQIEKELNPVEVAKIPDDYDYRTWEEKNDHENFFEPSPRDFEYDDESDWQEWYDENVL